MTQWDFKRESNQPATGANTVAGILKGYQPFAATTNMAEKRNVIATTAGWVRREHRVSVHGGTRTLNEVLVAAAPGSGLFYNSNTHLGKADISQIYVKLNANGVISANVSSNLYVVFNGPIKVKNSSNLLSITISNTVSGNSGVARFVAQTSVNLVNANNTLVFVMPKLQANAAGSTKNSATYHIGGQSISVTGNPIYNPEQGLTHSANLVITGAVANNLLDGVGTRITNITVVRNGLAV